MKVLHVITEMDPQMGGVCQAVRTIISGLTRLDVYNEVVSLDNPDAAFLKNDPFKVNALGTGKGPWKYNATLLPWLTNNIGRFDSVIVHGLWQYHTYATWKSMQLFQQQASGSTSGLGKRPQLFVMPHGMLDPYFQRAPGRKLKAVRNWVFWKLIEGNVINNADGLLFTCEDELLLARTTFTPYNPKREISVGLGVEAPPAYQASMREAFLQKCPEVGDNPYILFLSRIHEKKGVDLLVKAYGDVLAHHHAQQGSNQGNALAQPVPKLVIAGPGLDSAYGQLIRKMVADNAALQANVVFPGMLTADVKWGAFYTCDAFILPSHQENFGIAVVEAMACTKTVLISNQINIWREIEAGGGGIVADDTVEGTHALLSKWLSLPESKKRTSDALAAKTYEQAFAVLPVAQRLFSALFGSEAILKD